QFDEAYEHVRLPSDQCKPGNIDSDIPARRIRRVRIQQTPPAILEGEFVDFVRADRPRMLCGSAGIAESLLRSARERVLAGLLRRALRVHLNTRNCARAGTAPQHHLM